LTASYWAGFRSMKIVRGGISPPMVNGRQRREKGPPRLQFGRALIILNIAAKAAQPAYLA
jgi:hypothetical protein